LKRTLRLDRPVQATIKSRVSLKVCRTFEQMHARRSHRENIEQHSAKKRFRARPAHGLDVQRSEQGKMQSLPDLAGSRAARSRFTAQYKQ
jgi:hypothetical protein